MNRINPKSLNKLEKNKKFDLLRTLIMESNDNSTKKSLKKNIHLFKDVINMKCDRDWSVLLLACGYINCCDIVELLLKNNADPNMLTDGYTVLIYTCRYSNLNSNFKMVNLLLIYGADPNIKDIDGFDSFMISCRNSNNGSNIETVKLLLNHGIDVNTRNIEGFTPLMGSSRYTKTYSTIETVKVLLENGADPNLQNNDGNTALILSSRYTKKESSIETVKLLLEYGADVNIKNHVGWDALMQSCRYTDIDSTIETVKLLLENGANVNTKNIDGMYTLMMACMNTNIDSTNEIIKSLLEKGADINAINNDGMTALMVSCRYLDTISTPETIKFLLNYDNIDVNITTKDTKYNALMLLCEYHPNQHELVMLLKSKTNLNHINYKNKKIEDICLNEYMYLFLTTTLDNILQKHEIIKSECFICNEENIDCIRCKFDHYTCIKCLEKVRFNCEACQTSF
jgi:ankyrin repeat protein